MNLPAALWDALMQDPELREAMRQTEQFQLDLALYGTAAVPADSPLGRALMAREGPENRTGPPPAASPEGP
jgi:hypothetical protein